MPDAQRHHDRPPGEHSVLVGSEVLILVAFATVFLSLSVRAFDTDE